jgi:pantetheine-phosphate adenylyltransferase
MKQTAIYPGTFDPITHGHSDLVERAARVFDRVIVAIAANPVKAPTFSLPERIDMANAALAGLTGVEVCGFNQLLVEYARERQASIILRGLRVVSDFEYEFQLAGMNRKLDPGIETLYLMPAEQYAYISSSLVKEIAALGGDISPFVHAGVMAALYKKMR